MFSLTSVGAVDVR